MKTLKHRHGRKNRSLKGGLKKADFNNLMLNFDTKFNKNYSEFLESIKQLKLKPFPSEFKIEQIFNNSIFINEKINKSIQYGTTLFNLKFNVKKTDIQVSEYIKFLEKIINGIERQKISRTEGLADKSNIFYWKIGYLLVIFQNDNYKSIFEDGNYIQYIYDIGLGNTAEFPKQNLLHENTGQFKNPNQIIDKNRKEISDYYYEFMFKNLSDTYYNNAIKHKINDDNDNSFYNKHSIQIKTVVDNYEKLFNDYINAFKQGKTLPDKLSKNMEYDNSLDEINKINLAISIDINESIYPGTKKMIEFSKNKNNVKLQPAQLINKQYNNSTPEFLIGTINLYINDDTHTMFTFSEQGKEEKEQIDPTEYQNIIQIDAAEISHLDNKKAEAATTATATADAATAAAVKIAELELKIAELEQKPAENHNGLEPDLQQNEIGLPLKTSNEIENNNNRVDSVLPTEISISFNKQQFQKTIVSNIGNILNNIGLFEALITKLDETNTVILDKIKFIKTSITKFYAEISKIFGMEPSVTPNEPDSLAKGAMQANMASYLLAILFFTGLAGGTKQETGTRQETKGNFTFTLKKKMRTKNRNKSNDKTNKNRMKGGLITESEIEQIPMLAVNINKDIIQQIYLNIELLKHLKDNTLKNNIDDLIKIMTICQELYESICINLLKTGCEDPKRFFSALTSIFIPVSASAT